MTMLMDAKTLIGPPVDTSGNFDSILEIIIAGVLADADEFMEASIQKVVEKEVYFDGGESTLYLPHFNVSNVSVHIDGALMSSDEYTVYPGTELSAAKIRYGGSGISAFVTASEVSGGKFPIGPRIVKVTYDGGYDEADYPKGLRRKLLKQVSYEFRRRNDPGLSAVSSPDGSVQKFAMDEWLPDVEAELLRRRRICL